MTHVLQVMSLAFVVYFSQLTALALLHTPSAHSVFAVHESSP